MPVPAFTPAASTITVGLLLDRWLDEAVALTVRPRTLASYTYVVRVHLRPALGDVPLASLTAQHVQGLLNAKAAAGLAPRTVGYLRGVLRQALGFAERMDLVGRNVARLARPPRVPRRQVNPLTIDQARTFRAAIAGDRLEALYLVAVGCGLRQGEILGLRGVMRYRSRPTSSPVMTSSRGAPARSSVARRTPRSRSQVASTRSSCAPAVARRPSRQPKPPSSSCHSRASAADSASPHGTTQRSACSASLRLGMPSARLDRSIPVVWPKTRGAVSG